MDSCGVGGMGAVSPSFGGECDTCTYLKAIDDNTQKIAATMQAFISSSRSRGAATVGDVNRNPTKYITTGSSMRSTGESPYSWMAENHERMLNNVMNRVSYTSNASRYTNAAIRNATRGVNNNDKALRFFSENYYGDKSSGAYQVLETRLRETSPKTSNKLSNRLVSLGAALPKSAENIYGLLGEAGGEKSWLGTLLESSAVANKQTASNLSSGKYNKDIENILGKFSNDLAGASLAVRDFMHEQNQVNKGIKSAAIGIGQIALGGMVGLAGAGLAYMSSLALNPNQGGAQGLQRSTGAYGVGGAAAGAIAGAAIGSVVPIVGTAIGGAIGGALGYFGGSNIGIGINTTTALATAGIKDVSSSSVGNQIQEAVQNYFNASVSSNAAQGLMSFNYDRGRIGASRNFMGTMTMNDTQRQSFFSQMLLANRVSGISTNKAMLDIKQLGISGDTYAAAIGALQYSPGVVGRQDGLQQIAVDAIKLGRISPLLESSDIAYKNAGFIGKTRADALSSALLGESYGNILSDLQKGKISSKDLRNRLGTTGLSLSMLKDVDSDLYNVIAGAPQDKNVKHVDEEMLDQLKQLVKIEEKLFSVVSQTPAQKLAHRGQFQDKLNTFYSGVNA